MYFSFDGYNLEKPRKYENTADGRAIPLLQDFWKDPVLSITFGPAMPIFSSELIKVNNFEFFTGFRGDFS